MRKIPILPAPAVLAAFSVFMIFGGAGMSAIPAWAQSVTAPNQNATSQPAAAAAQNTAQNTLSHGSGSFEGWLGAFRAQARQEGISERTLQAALQDLSPNQRVIELDRRQPEGSTTFAQYRRNVVNQNRINQGRSLMRRHAAAIAQVERSYGVAPQYIVALWGIETNFGGNTGGFSVVQSLATLAWEGRRADFFRGELLHALRIIDQGHISAAGMKGSWAGAMGQNQFMPSSFMNFAVDADGDGRRDIWGTEIDVFASAANYLQKNGWQRGERWGRRVQLPPGFAEDLIGPRLTKPLAQWAALGVRNYGGGPLPVADMDASIVAPDGVGGEVYIVYANYQAVMRWNRSTYFATSVGLLADAIAAGSR